jgi:post-segregation antitoxin (ccd killing protein)
MAVHNRQPVQSPCVYYVCMARMNIYLPDDLAAKARAAGLNLSALARAAVEAELAKSLTDGWLEQVLALAPTSVSHDEAIEALDAAREDFGARD